MEAAVKRSPLSAHELITNGCKIFGGCSSLFNEAVKTGLPEAGIFRRTCSPCGSDMMLSTDKEIKNGVSQARLRGS
jgi:hypothetical protein